MIPLLPRWVLNSKSPAFYDTESATAIEMVAKLYGSMNKLIEDYNSFVDSINNQITFYNDSMNKDFELFRVSMRQEFQDFIDVVEIAIKKQDQYVKGLENQLEQYVAGLNEHYVEELHGEVENFKEYTQGELDKQNIKIDANTAKVDLMRVDIDNAINYMKTNLSESLTRAVEDEIAKGVVIGVGYDPDTESVAMQTLLLDKANTLTYDSGGEALEMKVLLDTEETGAIYEPDTENLDIL